MDDSAPKIIAAMATECLELLEQATVPGPDLPAALKPVHLRWMLTQVRRHAGDWPVTRLHRWLGFVQGGMVIQGTLDFETTSAMFGKVRATGRLENMDHDLADHLDAGNAFSLELGGES